MPGRLIVIGIIERVLNWRKIAPTVRLKVDGIKFEGWKNMTPDYREDGSIDYRATSSRQATVAVTHFKQAVTPDLGFIGGLLGAAVGSKDSLFKAIVAGTVVGAMGVVADVVEAVPVAVLGAIYGVTALVNRLRVKKEEKHNSMGPLPPSSQHTPIPSSASG